MDRIDNRPDSDESSSEDTAPAQNGRTARLRKSCESCRSQKAKCLPSEGSIRCQRCVRTATKCVFLAAKARPKKVMNSKARVAEMEQKLDGLMAMLEAKQQQNLTPDATPPPCDIHPEVFPEVQRIASINPSMTLQRREILGNPQQFNFSPLGTSINKPADVLSKGIISFQTAEEYLRVFRSKNAYFPFVVVPHTTSLENLRRERPFLLLAIFAFSSGQVHSNITSILEAELCETLAKRVIMEGEKSLDLLQGLLVYLAWYHFFFSPKKQQIYQFAQTATAMAIDLGIHKPRSAANLVSFNVISLITPPEFGYSVKTAEDPEARRTFLGTYYLASAVSHAMRRPNGNLRYSDYVGECCSFFATNPSTEYDHLLQYYVRLQHFQEEVNLAFDYDSALDLRSLDCTRVEILLGSFSRQLQQFQDSFPPEIWENPQMNLAYHGIKIYLHEIGYHASPPNPTLGSTQSKSWYHSPIRPLTLLSCLQSCKAFLTSIIALPTPVFLSLAMPEFTRLVYALLVLGSFSAPLPDSSPTLQGFRETANLQYFLDALVAKTDEIIKSSMSPGYIFHFNFLFKDKNEWHARNINEPGMKGRCLTDLVGDMFPISMRVEENPQLIGFESIPGASDILAQDFHQNVASLWPDMDNFAGFWDGEMDIESSMMG